MFTSSLPFHRKDGKIFDIEVVRVTHDEKEYFAARVWYDNVVVNDPKKTYSTNADTAYEKGLNFSREYK